VISSGFPAKPRIAIDADGIIYVTNGDYATGALYSFDPDLTRRWSETILNVNLGGPAIGPNGILVVCGVGTDVRAYRGESGVNEDLQAQPIRWDLEIFPNPFSDHVEIQWSGAISSELRVGIFDITGRLIRRFDDIEGRSGRALWSGRDASGRRVPNGLYLVKLEGEDSETVRKVLLTR
jgi:hypothetical protein